MSTGNAQYICVLLAFIAMAIAVRPPQPAPSTPPRRPIDWCRLSFALLILAWLVGGDSFQHLLHR